MSDRIHLAYIFAACLLLTSLVALVGLERWREREEAAACLACCEAEWGGADVCCDICDCEEETNE